MRTAALAPLLAALVLLAPGTARMRAAPAGMPQDAQTSGSCPNPLPHEPLVVYEVSGGTLVGPVDGLLTVYGDGLARLGSSLGPGPGFLYAVQVSPQVAAELHADLLAAGAMRQCDQPDLYNDVPLSTLTVLRAGTSPRAHTFSWWVAEGEVQAIEARLQGFIAATFPPPPTGGSGF